MFPSKSPAQGVKQPHIPPHGALCSPSRVLLSCLIHSVENEPLQKLTFQVSFIYSHIFSTIRPLIHYSLILLQHNRQILYQACHHSGILYQLVVENAAPLNQQQWFIHSAVATYEASGDCPCKCRTAELLLSLSITD